jgi:hypothetical protein
MTANVGAYPAMSATGRHHFGQVPERGGLFPADAAGVYEANQEPYEANQERA